MSTLSKNKRSAQNAGPRSLFTFIAGFISSNPVLIIAAALALVTSFIVTPDEKYASYFDLKTLTCLFCTLTAVGGLKKTGVFEKLSAAVIRTAGNLRGAVACLVFITYFGSMLIANDMALITFLPLGYCVLSASGKERYMAFTFVMQNIAANLGGMLTPFGNPQNLYLYSKFNIPDGEFVLTMTPPFAAAAVLIVICCFFVKREKITLPDGLDRKLPIVKTVIYSALFIYSILIVFRFIPYWTGLVIVPVTVFFVDRDVLAHVDYPLLLTFVCFFIFAGNMSRIDSVNALLTDLMKKDTLLFSVLSCQFISNVPSAVLLSNFTSNYRRLLVGVNIGGTGTLIASLASLITFREYAKHNPEKTGKYLLLFTALNFAFLLILLAVSYFTVK